MLTYGACSVIERNGFDGMEATCDREGCHQTEELDTDNFAAAVKMLRQEHGWKVYQDGDDEWVHECPLHGDSGGAGHMGW